MISSPPGIQTVFLEQVRSRLAPNLSFADELAELLNVSRDSAYRRIRGETVLSLDEVKILCDHYGVSLDSLLRASSDGVSFHLRALNTQNFSFEKWLKSLLDNLDMLISFPQGEMIWHAKDLPIFHYFQIPRLSAFKMFFWMKSFMGDAKYASGKYNSGMVTRNLIDLGEKIWSKYATVTSTEIINYEILNVTLRQIEFAYECGMFENKGEASNLCDDCITLVNNLKSQAEVGKKSVSGQSAKGGKFDLYLDEVLIGDNTVLLKMGDKMITVITHNNFNLLTTDQESFCKLTEHHMQMMMNKSMLISSTAEKERSKFFNKMEAKVQEVKAHLL